MDSTPHIPVMLEETMRLLSPEPGQTLVDGTLGAAGHARELRRALAGNGMLIGIDRDPEMAEIGRRRLLEESGAPVVVATSNYSEMDQVLAEHAPEGADGILLDLGVASPHLDRRERGFSYRSEGPLDMRLSGEGDLSAEEWINSAPEVEIADVLYRYGEERHSRRIARAIVRYRDHTPIRSTTELADIIARATPGGPRRLHPARRSFQGIRIFINREIEHLETFLEKLPRLLRPNGRCVIISYHSLEDRPVKNAFLAGAQAGLYERLTRKPLRPSEAEIMSNPRSRSAKLRAVRRTEGGAA